MFRILTIAILFILLNVANSPAREINVSRGTFPSIQQAIDSAQPGDTIVIGGGVYYENITVHRFGKSGTWTTIKARDGEDVVIDGSKEDAAALMLKNSRYLIIEGIHFTNARKYGFVSLDSEHVTVQNCKASQNQWEGFLALNSVATDFIDCIGYDNVGDSFNYNNSRDSVMKGCIQYRGGNGLSIERGSQNITVGNNIFYDNWADGILVYLNCKDILIKNNIIYQSYYRNPQDNGQGHCIKVTHQNDNVQIKNNRVANCRAAFSYEIAGNTSIYYDNNVLARIDSRIPVIPVKSQAGDVLYKGPGDYPEFNQCWWYSLKDVENNGWGQGNRYDDSIVPEMENRIKELMASGIIEKNENPERK